jgi:ATP-dependent RNA helicase DeaD
MASPAHPSLPSPGFKGLGLAESLVKSVTALGYEEPTPVQRETIPLILSGRDVIAQAATGTGKTAAFALPIINRLAADPTGSRRKGADGRRPARAVVLVPTRELAMQVSEAIHKYAHGTSLSVVPLYGGASMSQQIRALGRGADIIVATPGRLLDHLRRRTVDFGSLRMLVLDEADEMLDMGFAEDIDLILEATPATRQTTLIAATMPARLRSIAERHLRTPARIAIAGEKTPAGKVPRVRQVAYVVAHAHKAAALQRVLDVESPASAIVFCRTRLEVDALVETVNAHGYRAEALHGGMQQRQREAVMGRFRSAKSDLLIATDVAARGIDIPQVSHVFNYDVPSAPEVYVHRIGRTGRAGREGTAVTFAEPREHRLLRSIEQVTKQKVEVATLPTVADLRARRLDLTRASLRERLVAGDLDDVRVVVESLTEEFDVMDIAAAAVKLAHASLGGGEASEVPDLSTSERLRGSEQAGKRRDGGPRARGRRDAHGGDRSAVTRLFVGAGRKAGIRPNDLVGALINEAGISSGDLGAIEITDRFSLVEVPEALADDIVAAMRGATLRGERVRIRRERDGTAHRRFDRQ